MEILHKGGVTTFCEAGVVCLSLAVSVQPFPMAGVEDTHLSSTSAPGEADEGALGWGSCMFFAPGAPHPHISEASHCGGHTGACGGWPCPVLAPDRLGVEG